jgi:hypothetical protein
MHPVVVIDHPADQLSTPFDPDALIPLETILRMGSLCSNPLRNLVVPLIDQRQRIAPGSKT